MIKKRPYYIPEDLWIEDLPSYMLRAAYQHLPLESFGFHRSYSDEKRLILNSGWCRVRFFADWEAHPYAHYTGQYKLLIFYGRLHAPNHSLEMEWQGERCKCWLFLSFDHVLEFINETFFKSQKPSYADFDNIIAERIEKSADAISRSLAFEAEIWKHYAPELFYLFDLRRPELWEQYRAWLKARYIAEGRKEEEDERQGLIPYYRVC